MSKRIIATPSFRFLFSDSKNKRSTEPETGGARSRSADVLIPLQEAKFHSANNRHYIF